MSGAGPEVLCGSNQRPERVSIPPFHLLQERTDIRPATLFLVKTNLRGSWSLFFISFKKGHTSNIRPATLSSWLRQTILLCYKQADQQALNCLVVAAHQIPSSLPLRQGIFSLSRIYVLRTYQVVINLMFGGKNLWEFQPLGWFFTRGWAIRAHTPLKWARLHFSITMKTSWQF